MDSLCYCVVCGSRRNLDVNPEHSRTPIPGLFFREGWYLPWFVGLATGFILAFTLSIPLGFWGFFSAFVVAAVSQDAWQHHGWRKDLVCPVCHFDPVLFQSDPPLAKEKCLAVLTSRAPHAQPPIPSQAAATS